MGFFRSLGNLFRRMVGRRPKQPYKFTSGRAEALGKARGMQEIRKRAKKAGGGAGPIRDRPAAVRLYGGKRKR